MGAIAQVFSVFGTAVSDSRSVTETDARMRAIAWQLRTDLAGATAPTLPPLKPADDTGYFEIIEGPSTDTSLFFDVWSNAILIEPFLKTGTAGPDPQSDDRILGDTDDVLLFTTRSTDPPFLGKFENGKYEASVAEVAWFLRPTRSGTSPATSNPATYTLYRRQMLVVGYVGAGTFASSRNMVTSADLSTATGTTAWQKYMGRYDISARAARLTPTSTGTNFMPNTLADLTRRESRFMHNVDGITGTTGYPFQFPKTFQRDPAPDGLTFDGMAREGEDVVLANVIGFDVRVFDPTAPLQVNGANLLVPGDFGYATGSSDASGAYVDLGNGETTLSPSGLAVRFATQGDDNSSVLKADIPRDPKTWDTWSWHYESDGADQRGDGFDKATNGVDDDDDGSVDNGYADLNADGDFDDPGEHGEVDTSPPYPFPLRGIEVRIRCYEPSSRQVRQMTIRHTFVR
jgi:hypothetical protein